jgi:hypothetical protein
MRSLEHHAAIASILSTLSNRISALTNIYTYFEARNPADDALIDILHAHATQLLSAAEAMRFVEFVVPEPPPEPEIPDTGDEGDPGDAEPQP